MNNIEFYKNKLLEYKGQKASIGKLLDKEKQSNAKLYQDVLDSELANDIITYVALQTQSKFTFKLSNLVTAAMEYISDEPYKLNIESDVKRNQIECELSVESYGITNDPQKDMGGTINDIIAAVLRISTWSLSKNKSSPVFILDEPGKFISKDMKDKFSEFLKSLCDKLDIQIIMSTHSEDLIESADNIIKISKNGKYSKGVLQ